MIDSGNIYELSIIRFISDNERYKIIHTRLRYFREICTNDLTDAGFVLLRKRIDLRVAFPWIIVAILSTGQTFGKNLA